MIHPRSVRKYCTLQVLVGKILCFCGKEPEKSILIASFSFALHYKKNKNITSHVLHMETFVREPRPGVLCRIYSIFLKWTILNEWKYIILRRQKINLKVFESEGSWASCIKGTGYQGGGIHVGAQIPLQKQLIWSFNTHGVSISRVAIKRHLSKIGSQLQVKCMTFWEETMSTMGCQYFWDRE